MSRQYYEGNIYPQNVNDRWVFGSNYAGVHGAGTARFAKMHLNAEWGVSEGLTGQCYAIPTKDLDIVTLPLERIKTHVARFIDTTYSKTYLRFLITPVGTGLAGYSHQQMAPLFYEANQANCFFPSVWRQYLETQKKERVS